jgi:hypothetical protein
MPVRILPTVAETRQDHATVEQLRDAIDRGRAGDKVPVLDPAAAPLGADEEAAGTPLHSSAVHEAFRQEAGRSSGHSGRGRDANSADRNRPGAEPLIVTMVLFVAVLALVLWLM